ncbi:MAG: LysR family transcriptional regulator [Flammeovirgaceae bacterium]|nr:LysR family transcriptional regulator [Flammeovirgaceae bacterium]MBR08779.1 LysR family transcriptional regulator [Rickettsiales bacterium]HCX23291.1 LysR family transcriptional regulator [Cytophagales bacterium]
MHYTLHQLKIFLKVADYQSITKASNELHLTQPAISIQLKKLQEQFELPLTEVIGRQLYVTDFGKEIAMRSRRILEEADGIKDTIDQYKGLLTGKIKISVVSTGKYVIPYVLKDFMDMYPGIDISIDVSNKTRVVEGIQKNESDFSLVSVIPDDLNVHALELADNRLNLVGNVLFLDKIKKPKDLEKVTLLFREEGSATRNAMEQYLKSKNIKVGKSMELVSNEAVKQAINAGLGVSIVPLIGLRTALSREHIRVFPLPGLPIVTRWNLVYNKNKMLTPAQLELVKYMEKNKQRLVDEHFSWAH